MSHDVAQQNIVELLKTFGFDQSEVSVSYDDGTNTIWFKIASDNARMLLGRGAEALGAMNHIATKITERVFPDRTACPRVIIDAGDHEKKKIENLKTIAHMMAERARYFKSSISVDPMPAHERRIVHEFLAAMPDIQTESEGVGRDRHIVIRYTDQKI